MNADKTETKSPLSEEGKIQVALVVPKDLVKKTKDCLEAAEKLDKSVKIRQFCSNDRRTEVRLHWPARSEQAVGSFCIPTTLVTTSQDVNSLSRDDLLEWTATCRYETEISFVGIALQNGSTALTSLGRSTKIGMQANRLKKTVYSWLSDFDLEKAVFPTQELASCTWTYMVYPPLLLLPQRSFITSPFIRNTSSITKRLPSLYELLCKIFHVTHIAINAPIPAHTTHPSTDEPGMAHSQSSQSTENILRSPTNLTPLHGSFGPLLPPTHPPSPTDLTSAFWCTSRQNGIFQTWAPRYTMFSRGNISEKARILKLDSLTEAILGARPEETSAVDLYAGIGYFTFCYASMRVERVLCWEINGWSIEGLRRGAEGNGWGVRVVEEGEEWRGGGERVVVFREGNVDAGWRVEAVREMIPPVRHVNCGFLPSSRGGWEGAVRVLDRAGGWIHAHENIALRDVERRKREIVDVLVQLVESRYGSDPREKRKIDCEHLEQVKSYAPGIMHCVLDIRIALAADAP